MVSSKWNNIRILQKRLSLQDKQICRPKSSNIEQFWTLSSNCNGIFWVQLNHPNIALRKRYPQKTSRCSTISNLFCHLHLGVIYSCLQKSWKSGLPPPAYPQSSNFGPTLLLDVTNVHSIPPTNDFSGFSSKTLIRSIFC